MKLKIISEIENTQKLGSSILNKIKELLILDPNDTLKIKHETTLKSKIEQKNNDIVKLLDLLERGRLKIDNFRKELDNKKSENEKLIAVLKSDMGIL